MAYGFSPKLPLTYDKVDGPYALLKTVATMGHQNLKMLVLTNPGERVMDPNFGVGISRYLFENNVVINDGAIKSRIISQVQTYLPYISITDITIEDRSDANMVGVQITYFIDSFTQEEILYLKLENTAE